MSFPFLRVGAAILGCALLSVQITFAIYHGGPPYALVATVAAFAALAALPLMAVTAWSLGRMGAAAALMTATLALLVYTLPVTTGRMAEHREREAAALVAHEQLVRDTQQQLRIARDMQERAVLAEAQQCATGVGPLCLRDRRILEQRSDGVRRLEARHADLLASAPTGDLGTEILAWSVAWAGVTEAGLRKAIALAAALGLDVSIAALFGLAAHAGRQGEAVDDDGGDERPRKEPKPEPSKPRTASLGERWIEQYARENPDVSVSEAYKAYQQDFAGKGGKRMSRASFQERLRAAKAPA